MSMSALYADKEDADLKLAINHEDAEFSFEQVRKLPRVTNDEIVTSLELQLETKEYKELRDGYIKST